MTIEERLEKVERALAGGAVAEVVRARRFVLVDANGKPRADLVMTVEGPGLMMLDEGGDIRAALKMTVGGSMLSLFDGHSRLRTELYVTAAEPGLVLRDESGEVRTWLHVSEEGAKTEYKWVQKGDLGGFVRCES